MVWKIIVKELFIYITKKQVCGSIFIKTVKNIVWECSSVVGCLLSRHQALDLRPWQAKINNKGLSQWDFLFENQKGAITGVI